MRCINLRFTYLLIYKLNYYYYYYYYSRCSKYDGLKIFCKLFIENTL